MSRYGFLKCFFLFLERTLTKWLGAMNFGDAW
jgi:hypothetical protein